MKRRQFLKASGAVVAASITSRAAVPHVAPTLPRVLPLNNNWRFKAADVADQAAGEEGFVTVTLPHTNVELPWHSFDDRSYEFISTYRRSFRMPAAARGKRVFVDFEGAMTASTVFLNGYRLGEYLGGYTPFSFELTSHLRFGAPNTLTVRLDSTEQPNTPPFGHEVDYLTFGGIYREVALRVVPQLFLDNLHARTLDVLSRSPALEADLFLSEPVKEENWSARVDLLEGERVIATETMALPNGRKAAPFQPRSGNVYQQPGTMDDPARYVVRLENLKGVELWQLRSPKLYNVRATLLRNGVPVDELATRIGFREAKFTPEGFQLNGKHLKLRGLDRHQMFPFAGQAMAASAQRKDAEILRYDLQCNIVRTSHYPQSRHFLDRCDEVGLLVLEEITGWQHIGDQSWQDDAVDNVRRMLQRDWNRPSIVLWGVRINESPDNDAFYTRTNALAHEIDTTRQTGGIRNKMYSHLIEDVFTVNDFGSHCNRPTIRCI